MNAKRLGRIADAQGGLFARRQARECGFSAYQIHRRIDAGIWKRVRGPVLAAAGLRSTARLADRAAQLAVPRSVLAGPSAARCWDLGVTDDRTYLFVGPHDNPSLDGVRLFFDRLDPRDIQSFEGAAITSRARTVFDCLRVLPERAAVDLLDRALQRRWIALEELVERVRLTLVGATVAPSRHHGMGRQRPDQRRPRRHRRGRHRLRGRQAGDRVGRLGVSCNA